MKIQTSMIQKLKEKENELLRLKESENSLKENLDRLKEEKDLVSFELKDPIPGGSSVHSTELIVLPV